MPVRIPYPTGIPFFFPPSLHYPADQLLVSHSEFIPFRTFGEMNFVKTVTTRSALPQLDAHIVPLQKATTINTKYTQ
jgi:hypothetical protein